MSILNVGINPSGAKVGAAGFNHAVDSMGRKVDNFSKSAPRKMKTTFASITKGVKTMAKVSIGVFVGLTVTAGLLIKSLIQTGTEFARMQSALVTLEGGLAAGTAKWKELIDFAEKTPFMIAEVVNSYKLLKAYGLDPTLRVMTALGDAAAILGDDVFQRVARALGQISATGKVTLQDLNQLTEAGIDINVALKDAFGITRSEVGKLNAAIIAGVVTMKDVQGAFVTYMEDKFGGAMTNLMQTLEGQFMELKSKWELFKDSIMTSGLALYLTEMLKGFNKQIDILKKEGGLDEWADKISNAFIKGFSAILRVGASTLDVIVGIKNSINDMVDFYNGIPEGMKRQGLIRLILFGPESVEKMVAGARKVQGEYQEILDNLVVDPKNEYLIRLRDLYRVQHADLLKLAEAEKELNKIRGNSTAKTGKYAIAAENLIAKVEAGAKAAKDGVKETDALAASLDACTKFASSFAVSIRGPKIDLSTTIDLAALEEYNKILGKITRESLSEYGQGLHDIEKRYDDLIDAVQEHGDAADREFDEIADAVNELEVLKGNALEEYVESNEEALTRVYDLWQHTYEKMTDVLADFFETGKFNLKDFVGFFKRQLAEMAAAWVMGNQTGGGLSLSGMFGGTFGGGALVEVPQPGSANFIGPVQAGVQGASSALSLPGAYGAYTTAGGGWAGMKAGASSFFGGGSGGMAAMMPYVAAAVVAYDTISSGLSSAKGARKDPFSSSWERRGIPQIGTETMSRVAYPAVGVAADAAVASVIGSAAMSTALNTAAYSWLGPLGLGIALMGFDPLGIGKTFNKWFGNKKRSGLYGTYEVDEYSPETGWGAPEEPDWTTKRKGYKYKPAAESMMETGLNIMNALDSMFKNLLGAFGENWTNLFTTKMMEMDTLSFDFGINAEDKREFQKGWQKSWESLTEGLIDPIIDAGTALLSQALDGTVTDSKVWNYFSDEMQEYLKTSLEDSLGDLKVDWSTVTDQKSFEAAIEQMGLAAEEIAAIMEYFDTVGAILDHITTTIDMHGYSDSVKSAVSELDNINTEFMTLKLTLASLGVDLEKYPDLMIAYGLAMQDWIENAFAGAISYASTSRGWQAMAPQTTSLADQYVGQYQHVQELAAACDGSTASAIALSDAFGILSGLSYDLAAEIQSAIDSINQSYTSTLESMYLETLSKQGKYDYYRAEIDRMTAELTTLTDPAKIRQYEADILKYSAASYGMLSEEQKKQYYGDYEAFLLSVQTAGTERLKEIGDALDNVNADLIDELGPMLTKIAQDIQDAAILNLQAADTQKVAADTQLDAAGTPITVYGNIDGAEVG